MKVKRELFGTIGERKIYKYTFENSGGIRVSVINYGGIITDLWVPDLNGRSRNVVLGYDTLEAYINDTAYMGALIGRFANRIRDGRFVLNGKEYKLSRNAMGKHHIHGGVKGFNRVVWEVEQREGNNREILMLKYLSRDGEEGYPGNLLVTVSYVLTEQNELIIDYLAETDRATPVNLTNHTYWNLEGAGEGKIYDHLLELNCSKYLEVDDEIIPTGRILDVDGTPMDFIVPKRIGEDIDMLANGYDHCYVITPYTKKLNVFARVYSPKSGISMEIATTMPGVQFYSGNFLRGKFEKHSAFCLETQFYPDSPNRPEFPNCILKPGEVYKHTTVYHFK